MLVYDHYLYANNNFPLILFIKLWQETILKQLFQISELTQKYQNLG